MNEEAIAKRFGRMVRNKRRHQELTQADVGKELKCSFQQVQKYEKGKNRISLPKLILMFKTLDIKFALLDQVFADVQLPSELQIQLESEENVERT